MVCAVIGGLASAQAAHGQSASASDGTNYPAAPSSFPAALPPNPAALPPNSVYSNTATPYAATPQAFQTTPEIRTRNPGNNRLGGSGVSQSLAAPVRAQAPVRTLAVTASGQVIYDTNALRTNADRPNGSKDDVIFPLGASIDLVVPSGKNVFTLLGSAGYNFYARNTRLNSESINLRGSYTRDLHPCSIDLGGTILRSLSDFADTIDLTFVKNYQTTGLLEGTLTCGGPTGLRPFASINYANASNTRAARKPNDYETIVYGGGVELASGSAGTIGVIGSLSDSVYPGRPVTAELGSREIHVRTIGGYFHRTSARILQVELQLNYTSVRKALGAPAYSGISGSAQVQLMPGGRVRLTGLVSRAVQTSFTNLASYTIETDYSLTAAVPVNPRLSASTFYLRQERDYKGVVVRNGIRLTSDTLQSAGGSVIYRVSQRISLNGSVIYQDRSANEPIFNYSGLKFIVGANVRI